MCVQPAQCSVVQRRVVCCHAATIGLRDCMHAERMDKMQGKQGLYGLTNGGAGLREKTEQSNPWVLSSLPGLSFCLALV